MLIRYGLIILIGILGLAAGTAPLAHSKEFEIFDGRSYNGKYYPRVDIIEWTENGHTQSSMEFQVYWKGHPVEMSFQLEKEGKKRVMLVHYFIKDRNEHLCRRVLAPGHFETGFMVYKDSSDKDMDNTIVTMNEIPSKNGLAMINPPKYTGCVEADETERVPAATTGQGEDHNMAPPSVDGEKTPQVKGGGGLKKKGVAVPFGDL